MSRPPPTLDVRIDHMLPQGQAWGRSGDFKVEAYGALPGELVRVHVLKGRRRSAKGEVEAVLEPSPLRRPERDAHFTSTSPWQIIPEPEQRRLKAESVKAMFLARAGEVPLADASCSDGPDRASSVSDGLNLETLQTVACEPFWGYRNKMEFGFAQTPDGLSLAFSRRFRFDLPVPVMGSAIASDLINTVAGHIIGELRRRGVLRARLKNLVVRSSEYEQKCIAVLYVTDPEFPAFSVEHPLLAGWGIHYSTPLSPTTVTTAVLHQEGRLSLTEQILDNDLAYGYDSFFQVHPRGFGTLLEAVRERLNPGGRLLDLYSGVGTIGLALADRFDEVTLLEYGERACEYATENARHCGARNVRVINGLAEKADLEPLLERTDVLIVDPPRSGLHPKVRRRIVSSGPKTFVYVSCNPLTQATDYEELKGAYEPHWWRLFDFYPQTPHVESVLVLNRKKIRTI